MFKISPLLISISLLLGFPTLGKSQIIPDNTLPNNTVTLPNGDVLKIQGGTTRGNSLFHSFSEFSVPINSTAWFNNSPDIQNIFSRVTGGKISNINGLIRANDTANLFLLNPAGIIFGRDASLNIGGSFFVTTADSFDFGDDGQFSAIDPQAPPLLTVNIPIGLQYNSIPGKIVVEGNGHNLFGDPETVATVKDNRPVGLQVSQGKTLALLGGEVTLEGGNLTAESGNIEVWSVNNNSQLSIIRDNKQFRIQSPLSNISYADINLSQSASIDVSGNNSGDINIRSKNLTLTNGSSILADTLGDGNGGLLRVETSESITLEGTTPNIDFGSSLFTEIAPGATGEGSDLVVKTKNLSISGGAIISSSNFGTGIPGKLQVIAKDIEIIGGAVIDNTTISPSGIFSQALFSGTGNGGDISVETENLLVSDGANISTITFAAGNSGNITIEAREINTLGTSVDGFPSAITTNIFLGAGNAGKININTNKLLMTDGANISSATFDVGNAGELSVKAKDIELRGTNSDGSFPTIITNQVGEGSIGEGADLTVETNYLTITDGAQINTITFGEGNAGNLIVNATESVELKRASSSTRGGLFASAIQGTGNGGNLVLNTKQLTVEDGATIGVSNFHSRNLLPPGEGAAGNLDIQTNSINLDEGIITAEANSGDKGNINLTSEQILLQNNSLVTTNAKETATGGDIFIDTETLTAIGNSDITANARSNFAGRITINATGILGLEFRDKLTPKSDITATSKLGAEFNGIVQLNTPDADPTSSLDNLPDNILDATTIILANCPSDKENFFAVAGKGGLPENPTQNLRTTTVWDDVRLLTMEGNSIHHALEQPVFSNKNNNYQSIVEAKGWMVNDHGKLVLTATPINNSTKPLVFSTLNCQTVTH